MAEAALQPRVVRLRDAPTYLGMDKHRFNDDVRPFVPEVPVGKQGVGFDRHDLDKWFDAYKARRGRPRKVEIEWGAKSRQGLSSKVKSGTSTKPSVGSEFAKAAKQLISKKQRNS